jgi:hypothetical protein
MTQWLKHEFELAWARYQLLEAFLPRGTGYRDGANPETAGRSKPGSRLLVAADVFDLRTELARFVPEWNNRAGARLDPQYVRYVSQETGFVCPYCETPALVAWPNKQIILCDPRYDGCARQWAGRGEWNLLKDILEDQRRGYTGVEVMTVYGQPRLRQRGDGGRWTSRRVG